MENAAKALLISAAVLIVIVLIGLGVSLLNSARDAQTIAQSQSTAIQLQTDDASTSAISQMNLITENTKPTYTKEEFNTKICAYFEKYQKKGKYTNDSEFCWSKNNNTDKILKELEKISKVYSSTNRKIEFYYLNKKYDLKDMSQAIKNNTRPAYVIYYTAGSDGYISQIKIGAGFPIIPIH